MSLLNYAHREVATLLPTATVAQAAQKMTDHNVGSLVVVDGNIPIGILTDRDIVTRVMAAGKDAGSTTVESVMSKELITLEEEWSLFEALELIKENAVRRFPLIDTRGQLSGIFTLDDVMYLLGVQMSAVARIVEQEGM